MRLRQAGGRHFVDVVVGIAADAALGQGHALADRVEEAVHRALPGSDVVVHVEPAEAPDDLRQRASGAALTVPHVREVHNVSVLVVGRRPRAVAAPQAAARPAPGRRPRRRRRRRARDPRACRRSATCTSTSSRSRAATRPPPSSRSLEVAHVDRAIRDIVREVTGSAARDVRIRRGPDGLLALLTVCVPGDRALGEAHDAAGEIERRVRDASPELQEVVVHTEPG